MAACITSVIEASQRTAGCELSVSGCMLLLRNHVPKCCDSARHPLRFSENHTRRPGTARTCGAVLWPLPEAATVALAGDMGHVWCADELRVVRGGAVRQRAANVRCHRKMVLALSRSCGPLASSRFPSAAPGNKQFGKAEL